MSSIDFSHALLVIIFAVKQQLLQDIKAHDAILNESLATRDA